MRKLANLIVTCSFIIGICGSIGAQTPSAMEQTRPSTEAANEGGERRLFYLPDGRIVSAPADVSEDEVYARAGFPRNTTPTKIEPNLAHIVVDDNFTVYKWGVLLFYFSLILSIDLLANKSKVLPQMARWIPTTWVGVTVGGELAALNSCYRLDGADPQKIAMLSQHPLASGLGAGMPVFLGCLAAWYFTRRRILGREAQC